MVKEAVASVPVPVSELTVAGFGTVASVLGMVLAGVPFVTAGVVRTGALGT